MISNFKLFLVMCLPYHWQFQTIENPHYEIVWREHPNWIEYRQFWFLVKLSLLLWENISANLKIYINYEIIKSLNIFNSFQLS